MSYQSTKLYTIILIIVALCVLGLVVSAVAGSSSALLWLSPVDASAPVGATTAIFMQLADISNVYGAHVELSFDPSILSVVDADSGAPGVQIATGSCPAPDFIVSNSANNSSGTIIYSVTQINPTPACNGGDVATIEFQCESNGLSVVTIESSLISDPNGIAIDHSVQHSTVECLGGFQITGSVALQGWSDPSGTIVTLHNSSGTIVYGPENVGADGAFTLYAVDVLETYKVQATHDRYLGVQATGITGSAGSDIDLGLAVLPAGDLNGDGEVNILDINMATGNFQQTSPVDWG